MSLYDTLQKTKKELPYRFQRLQAEADAKRSEPVPYREKDTQNSREVSRDQGIRDSYRQRVENDRNTALASMGNQGVPTGKTLIEKATSGLGQAGTIPQQKSVRQYLGLDPTEQQEQTPKPKSTLELLEQQREQQQRGTFKKQGGGGFGSNDEMHTNQRPAMQTVGDVISRGAGQVDLGVLKTIDFAANAIPIAAGAIQGAEPESTFTGQLFKPLTDVTGWAVDYMQRGVENMNRDIAEDTKDSKAAQIAADVGTVVVGALPNAALAMMTGGASAGGTIGSQLAPQASGLAGTVSSAWQKLISNPMFQTSFIQSLGSGYEEAKEAGASDVNAMAAALLSTTANSIVEVGGGVETLPGELKNADLSTGKKALQWLTSALDEGKEEVVQGAISSMVNKAASGSDTPYFSMTDENAVVNPLRMGQEFGMGAAVGGILGGGQVLADSMLQKAANRSGNVQDEATPSQTLPDSPLEEGAQGDGMGKLDAAIHETMKPTETPLDRAMMDTFQQLHGQTQTDGAPSGRALQGAEQGTGSVVASTAPSQAESANVNNPGSVQEQAVVDSVRKKWEKYLAKNNGRLSFEKYIAFANTLSDAESESFVSYLDEQERAGNIKYDAQSVPYTPTKESHIDNRDYGTVGDRNVRAFQYDHPELHSYIAEGANWLGNEVASSNIGQRFYDDSTGKWTGTKRRTTPEIAELKDTYGMSWSDINKAIDDLIADSGRENYAGAKRVELVIDKLLTNGYRSLDGYDIPHNQEYINEKNRILNGSGDVGQSEYPGGGSVGGAQNKTAHADTGAESTNVNTNPSIQTPQEQAVDALFPGMDGDVGDMGAKTSDFEHKVKESQTAQNTIGKNEARWNVPEDQRVNQQYDAVTEQESLNNARMRIEQDLPGEQEALRRAAVWSNEEVDMGMLILGGLRKKAKETGDWTAYKDWAEVVKQHGVASGQGLQAWAKYTRRTGDGIMQTVAGLLESPKNGTDVNDVLETASHYADRFDDAVAAKSVSDLVSIIQDAAVTRKTKRSWGKKLGGEIDWALKRIADYADAEVRAAMNQEGDGNLQNYEFLRDFAAASIEDIAGDHVKTSLGKMALTVRRMAMLSKASTSMRNLVGNEAFDLVDTLARNISVPLDMLLSKMTGTRSMAFDSGALSKTGMKGQLDGLAKALLEVGLDVNAGGASSKYENSANRTFKMSGNVVSKLFSTWEKYMGYALNVTDEMKKGSVDARVQKGLDKLYEQGKIKDDSLRTGGQQEALYRTFQDKTLLSDISIGARNVLNQAHVGDVGLGNIAMPFAQVPANLADRAIDYSPAGLVESTVNLSKVLLKAKKGTLTAAEQAQAVQNLGRNITGSALIAIAAGLALKGFIRVVNPGDEDENKDKAAFEKMQGQSGTQFNVSAFLRSQNGGSADWQDGDTLVSIAFLEPFNAHLTIGALLAEDMKEEGQLTAKTIANDTFTGSLAAILDLPMFEKFRDVSDAYTYSTKERTGEKLLDAVNTLAANEVGSLIPNSVKGIAQGLDPYQRDLYSKDDPWGQAADQFRAVFDRDSLPIKQDSLGRDMMNEGGFLNFLNSNILPGQITTYKTDELLDKITDLSALTGKASVYPSRKAPDKITVDGEDVPLTQEQQRQYQSTYGQTEYDTRSALIENSLYDNLTPQEELKAHGYAEDYAKQVAKSDVNADFEPDSWVEDLKGKTPAEVADAIMLKTFQSMAEDKKNYDSKYDGITDMLDSGTIDEAMAVSMLPEQASSGYYKYIKGSGIELSTFIDVYQFKKNAKQEEVIEYINKVGRGPGQKRRMFLAMGYSEKNLPEEWK